MPTRLGFSCNVTFDGIINVSEVDPEDVGNMFFWNLAPCFSDRQAIQCHNTADHSVQDFEWHLTYIFASW